MVVIDNAKTMVGKTVGVSVSSILQTSGGRMIFAKLKEDGNRKVYLHASN